MQNRLQNQRQRKQPESNESPQAGSSLNQVRKLNLQVRNWYDEEHKSSSSEEYNVAENEVDSCNC